MKIVNFIRHKTPIRCGVNDIFIQYASFDLEVSMDNVPSLWVGWSVRAHHKKGILFLQGPRIYSGSSTKEGMAIKLPEVACKIFLDAIKSDLKSKYQLEILPDEQIRNA